MKEKKRGRGWSGFPHTYGKHRIHFTAQVSGYSLEMKSLHFHF